MKAALALLCLAACERGPEHAASNPGVSPSLWRGATRDGGFGARLASDGEQVVASAPFAGEVWRLDAKGVSTRESSSSVDFYGSGLAFSGSELLVGSPLEATVWRADGGALTGDPGFGGLIAAGEDGVAVSTSTGFVAGKTIDALGRPTVLGRRPDALLLFSGHVISGAAFGETALWQDSLPSARAEAPLGTDAAEEGYALAACDTDGDGVSELIVGAPGRGQIRVGATWIGPGTGRFGASIACGTTPGVVWVGAPAAGAMHNGGVYLVENLGEPSQVLAGDDLDELGTALVVAEAVLYSGAPGPADGKGLVRGSPESELLPK